VAANSVVLAKWPPTLELFFNMNSKKELWMEKLPAKWPPTLMSVSKQLMPPGLPGKSGIFQPPALDGTTRSKKLLEITPPAV
jgi:hypothetical protein